MQKYLFFGDSVTEAHRNMDNPNDLGQGFIFKLNQIYDKDQFINKGIGGQRIKDLMNRVDIDVISLNPNVCFIWIGVNDAWLPYLLNQTSSLNSFFEDYCKLIEVITKKLKDIKIVLIKPFALPIGAVSINIYKDLELLRNDVESVSDKYKLDIIEIKKDVEEQLHYMPADQLFYDGIHPTPKGYELITTVISKYIKEYLK